MNVFSTPMFDVTVLMAGCPWEVPWALMASRERSRGTSRAPTATYVGARGIP